jgi:TRAP-type C4-dicarboxylate transport system substrate-binding protein
MRSLDGILAAKGVMVPAPSVAAAAAPSRSRTTRYVAIGLAVLVVGAGALWAALRIFEGSRDPQRGVAASTPVASVPGAPPPSIEQQPLVLKSTDEFFVRKYANDIKAENVNLAIEIDTAAVNTGIDAQWDAMVKGELALASFYLSSVADRVPAFAATSLPGLIRNREHAARVNTSAFMAQIKRMAAEAGVIVIADAWQSTAVFSKRRCIRNPGDAKGLKIVIFGSGGGVEPMLRAAGAVSVDLMPGDVADAFKSGADALIANLVAGRSIITEAGLCVTVPGEYTLGFGYVPLLASKKTFGQLSVGQQNALLKAARALDRFQADGLKQIDDYLAGLLTASGVQTVALSEADYGAWLKVAQASAYKEFAATVPGGKELLDEALAVK